MEYPTTNIVISFNILLSNKKDKNSVFRPITIYRTAKAKDINNKNPFSSSHLNSLILFLLQYKYKET